MNNLIDKSFKHIQAAEYTRHCTLTPPVCETIRSIQAMNYLEFSNAASKLELDSSARRRRKDDDRTHPQRAAASIAASLRPSLHFPMPFNIIKTNIREESIRGRARQTLARSAEQGFEVDK